MIGRRTAGLACSRCSDVRFTAKVRLSCRRACFQFPLERRKRACRRLVTGFFQTISICRDGLKPRNLPVTLVTGKFRGSRRNRIWALLKKF